MSASSLWSTRVTPGPVAENVNFSHQDPSCVEYRRNIISQHEFEPPTRRNSATRNPKLRYLANSIIHALLRPRSYSELNVLRQIERRDLVRDLFQTLHRNSSTRKIARFPRLSPTIPFIEYKFGEEGCSRDRTNSKRVLLFIAVHSRSSRPMHGSERVKFSHLPPHIRFYSGCSGPADIIRLILDYRRLPVMNFHANEPRRDPPSILLSTSRPSHDIRPSAARPRGRRERRVPIDSAPSLSATTTADYREIFASALPAPTSNSTNSTGSRIFASNRVQNT